MKLIDKEGFLELERSETGERGTPGESEILLNVTVEVSSYSAADQSWVIADEWDRFLTELTTLEERRQGLAIVEGLHGMTSDWSSIQPIQQATWRYGAMLVGISLTATFYS
jgi:hypothetical protein